MGKCFLGLAALAALGAPVCLSASAGQDTTGLPDHRERGVADPRAFVVQVYRAYGRGDSTPGPDVAYSFSDRLRRLFHDYEAWERAHGELVGALIFDWWTNSQQWWLSHVVITQTDSGPDSRFVIARFDNEGRHETNRFEFVRIGGRWYLDDVVNGAGTGDGSSTAPGSQGWTLSALLRGLGARPVFEGDAAAPAAASPAIAEPLLENCHMDICSYSRLVRRETLRETSAGRLLKVTLLGGEQGDASDAGPDGNASIVWNREPHNIFVFCSTRLPAVMMRVPGRRTLQTDLLNLGGPNAITTVLVSSANLYMEICHGLRDRDLSEETAGLGYRPISQALLDSGIDIERPEEIFNFAR